MEGLQSMGPTPSSLIVWIENGHTNFKLLSHVQFRTSFNYWSGDFLKFL